MTRRQPDGFPAEPFSLLLVEGGDERTVCQAVVEPDVWGRLRCWPASGRSDLVKLAELARRDPRFDQVRAVGVLLDMEEDPEESRKLAGKVLSVFGSTGTPEHGTLEGTPVLLGAFFAPDGVQRGAIESLCKRAVQHPELIPCVDELLRCAGDPHLLRAQADKGALPTAWSGLLSPRPAAHRPWGGGGGSVTS